MFGLTLKVLSEAGYFQTEGVVYTGDSSLQLGIVYAHAND